MKLTQVALLLAVAALARAELLQINTKTSDPCVSPLWVVPYPTQDCVPSRPPSNEVLYFPDTLPTPATASAITVLYPANAPATPNPNFVLPVSTLSTGVAQQFGLAPLGGDCATQTATSIPANWIVGIAGGVNPTAALSSLASTLLEFEPAPRKICYRVVGASNWVWTGLYYAVVWTGPLNNGAGCATNAECLAHPVLTSPSLPLGYGFVTPQQKAQLATQTVCCAGQGGRPGICQNPAVQSCCGGVAIENTLERCCEALSETTRYIGSPCPCQKIASGTTGCPTGEFCCLPQKYPELNQTAAFTVLNFYGECYDPTVDRCCNTGETYDPGAQQCCSISGLQSLDVACPCGSDLDCAGGQFDATGGTGQRFTTMRCCLQSQPPLSADDYYCNAYSNFPSLADSAGNPITIGDVAFNTFLPRYPEFFRPGQGDYLNNLCPGTCVDTSFQICCNGAPCYGSYHYCCNATCCNKHNQGCLEALLPIRNSFESREFMIKYQGCTTTETLTSERAFWVFVVPIFLLIATLASFAIVVVFANTITSRSYSFVERLWVLFSILAIIFACPTYFSPIYKYGIVAVVVALISILSAAARVRWLNILAVGATIVFILYLFDPFHGNNYWNLASLRLPNGNPWPWASGVINSIRGFWGQHTNDYCTWFYHGYFRWDTNLQDLARWDNPAVANFGYCDRGWATALLVFEGLQLLISLWLFALALLALILRFRKIGITPVEIDAVPTPLAPIPVAPQVVPYPVY